MNSIVFGSGVVLRPRQHVASIAPSALSRMGVKSRLTVNYVSAKHRSIYKSSEAPPLWSFYRSTQINSLPRMSPFPSPNSHSSKGETNITKNLRSPWPPRIRLFPASDFWPYPTLSESHSFWRCIDPKRISFVRTTNYRMNMPCA